MVEGREPVTMHASTDTTRTPTRQFLADLARSGEVLVRHPLLPLLTLGLALLTQYPMLRDHFDSWAQTISLLAWVVMAGWVGTQRIWFLRAFRGEAMRPAELVTLTVAFTPRFVLLGLLITLPTLVVVPLATVWVHDPRTLFTVWLVLPLVVSVATDVVLTFVTPALAYSTTKLRRAFRLGLGMLRHEWPRCAWYALVPPFAITMLVRLIPRSALGPATGATIGLMGFMVGLWFKGAIAAYYLRCRPVEASVDAAVAT